MMPYCICIPRSSAILATGNTGATIEGPCMFDPASFFGHSEFELAIVDMFGGFQEPFWSAYHGKVCVLRSNADLSERLAS